MDDPWAGPSWSTPAKPSSSIIMTMPEPGRATPPPRFDESDPWGTTHPPQSRSPVQATEDTLQNGDEVKSEVLDTPRWVGEEHSSWDRDQSETVTAYPQEKSKPPAIQGAEEASDWLEPDSSFPTSPSIPPSSPQQVKATSPTISPDALHKSTPPSIPTFADESFELIASNLTSLPKSPSFGDDFGTFSAGPSYSSSSADLWGTNAGPSTGQTTVKPDSGGWGGEDLSWTAPKDEMPSWGGEASFDDDRDQSPFQSPIIPHKQVQDDNEQDGDEGWGRSRPPIAVMERPKGDDDWEEAQRRIQVKQERAPQEKIDGLTKAWTDLLGGLIHIDLEKMTGAEEMVFEGKVKELNNETADQIRMFSVIPSNINTYPPIISDLMTHERYTYALQRPNPVPSTSLLTFTNPRRQGKVDPLSFSDDPSNPSWTSRSKLGEPDAPVLDISPQQQEDVNNKSKWSFWGKRPVPERQLTTSGGGVLERKSTTISSPDLTNERASADMRTSTSSRPSSRAPSISVQPSRPSSPALPTTQTAVPKITQDMGHSSPSTSLPQAPNQPSAVSRFFGRLSRNKSTTPAHYDDEHDKDLQLSPDDFSFLSEVPSLSTPPPEKGVGDLLALEAGRGEDIASLESLLNSKVTPLPKPLAPPPKGSAPIGYRSNSGKFVARMTPSAPTNLDLLGDLNFDGPADSELATTNVQSPITQFPSHVPSPASNTWDDFLSLDAGPSQNRRESVPSNVRSPVTSVIASPLVPSRSGTPGVSLSPPPPLSQSTLPALSSFTKPFPAASTQADTGRIDSDDFGTPRHASTSTFDDFGDFSAFNAESNSSHSTQPIMSEQTSYTCNLETPSKPPAMVAPGPAHALSTPVNHTKPGSLDHTPTLQLLSGASASKGKRWPAPPSPVAPILAPPPKPSQVSTGGFPFLSPPPPGRPSSRSSNLLDDLNGDASASTKHSTAVGIGINNLGNPDQDLGLFGGSLQPSRSITPSQFGQAVQPINDNDQASQLPKAVQGKGGLSAQDLSFFDSL
ncbi:uncharacterized protein I206_105860 [Kwoniella pini CBS 10737]|uniref:Uncharacterized protein n=1 Tax=Kwoniella pini CBS 10737 TaxID=1296096 RepID=A0A1B9I0C6_9TREE|nr:uncharacterized protein I206_04680 [Kwoniella pini CBS 10737]OCF48993.1 hypothetical protein I206_04680 [Kwoniella pini CBS 10737]